MENENKKVNINFVTYDITLSTYLDDGDKITSHLFSLKSGKEDSTNVQIYLNKEHLSILREVCVTALTVAEGDSITPVFPVEEVIDSLCKRSTFWREKLKPEEATDKLEE